MDATGIAVPEDWYDGFFEEDWLDHIALHVERERTERESAFVVEALALEPGERVLDLCCGHGRLTIALAQRGLHMTGLDLSRRSLLLAREAAERADVEVEWIHADMREIPRDATYDAIYNVFTSFGYFEEEAENERVLEGVARALRPGGRFLLDTINLLGLMPRYQDRYWDERPDGVLQLAEHDLDLLGGRNRARWTFIHPDGSRSELVHSVRMYTAHDLTVMLARAGLEVDGAWGAFDGSELDRHSRRVILRARRL